MKILRRATNKIYKVTYQNKRINYYKKFMVIYKNKMKK